MKIVEDITDFGTDKKNAPARRTANETEFTVLVAVARTARTGYSASYSALVRGPVTIHFPVPEELYNDGIWGELASPQHLLVMT